MTVFTFLYLSDKLSVWIAGLIYRCACGPRAYAEHALHRFLEIGLVDDLSATDTERGDPWRDHAHGIQLKSMWTLHDTPVS